MAKKPFNLTHANLDAALSFCALSKCEQAVMRVARVLCYTKARQRGLDHPLPFVLNLSIIARESGFTRAKISAALARLKASRILVPDSKHPGALVINKRYHAWIGAHALTKTQIESADRANEETMGGYVIMPATHENGRASVPEREHPLFPKGNTPCSRKGTPPVPEREHPHVYARARDDLSRDRKKIELDSIQTRRKTKNASRPRPDEPKQESTHAASANGSPGPTAGQAEFLSRLTHDQRARFDHARPSKRAEFLAPHAAGFDTSVFTLQAKEIDRIKLAAAQPLPLDADVPTMVAALVSEHDPALPARLKRTLITALGDEKDHWSFFDALVERVRAHQEPPESITVPFAKTVQSLAGPKPPRRPAAYFTTAAKNWRRENGNARGLV